MRSLMISMALLSFAKMCGGEPASTPPVSVAATSALTVTAQHGGVMVSADDAWVELVTKDSGEVEAYVVDAQGQPLPREAAQVTQVAVQGSDGRPHEVQLRWDESQHRYAGRVEVRPVATAPAELQLVVRGEPRQARASRIVVVTPPSPSVVVERPAAPRTVVVTPPQPSVVVEQPRANVVVVGPPRPSVIVTPPAPPVIVAPPRPGVVVVAPQPQVGVVVDGHPGRGRGHAYGRRGREPSVIVSAPRPAVVVTPPRPGRIEVRGRGGRVEVRGHHGGRGRGRGH